MSNEIGRRIKALRTERGWRQDDLAEKLHVTRQAVSNWENGKTYVSVDYLNACAGIFDVSLDELVYGGKAVKRGYEPMQTKYKIAAAISLAGIIICIVLSFTLRPWALEQRQARFVMMPVIIYLALRSMLLGISVPVLVMSVCSFWGDIRLRNRGLRWCILLAGVLLMLPLAYYYISAFLGYGISFINIPVLYAIVRFTVFNFSLLTNTVPYIFGICLFLFFNRKN